MPSVQYVFSMESMRVFMLDVFLNASFIEYCKSLDKMGFLPPQKVYKFVDGENVPAGDLLMQHCIWPHWNNTFSSYISRRLILLAHFTSFAK